ncbi:glutamate--cysteine ligase [Paucilactobacillus nenjiangensis]|uniref:glutamate--cysteine ligase n=1 Tax=Paucilactobacillus nenjiangensis TaxID=1296540 RepID=UPI003FA22FDA
MSENVGEKIKQLGLTNKLFEGFFGLEQEEHRVTADGRISRYPYPTKFGSRKNHPYLQSDFTDSMLELITEPTKGGREAVKNLKMLQQIVNAQLHDDERIWPLSMPPKLEEDDEEFIHQDFHRDWYQDYRDYLEQKYGAKYEIIAGSHVNFSVNDTLLYQLYQADNGENFESVADLRNHMYFKLSQYFVLYRWFFTYLYGASPITENPLEHLPADLEFPVRSLRNSSLGYANRENETITYDSLTEQTAQLKQFVADGTFYSTQEFYGPVRLKGMTHDDDIDEMLEEGVTYLEFRSFDLDPFSRSGVSDDTLDMLELLMGYCLVSVVPTDIKEQLRHAADKNEEVALQNPLEQPEWLVEEANQLLDNLAAFVEEYDAPKKYSFAIEIARKRVRNPALTISGQLLARIEDDSLEAFGLKIANDRYQKLHALELPLEVISKEYSVVAQELIKAAILLGIRVKLFNGIKLTHGSHHEWFENHPRLEFPNGARDYLLKMFPEIKE